MNSSFSFSNVKSPGNSPRRLLKTDWSVEEAKFKASLPAFRKAIEVANPIVQRPPSACGNSEKNGEEAQGAGPSLVVSGNRESKAPDGVLAPEKSETKLAPQAPSGPKAPDEGLKEKALSASATDPFDFFQPQKAAPQEKPASAPPSPPPAPVPKDAKPADPFDAESVASAAKPASWKPDPAQAPSKDAEAALLEGFDFEKFKVAQEIARRIQSHVTDVDFDALAKRLPEYEVSLKVDSYAADPGQLTDKMVVLQAHRDAVHAELLKIEPLADVAKAALDIVYSIGDSCSQASSEKKRRAQVQIVVRDLLEKQEIAAVYLARVERSYRHLEKQHETVSRILSWHQQQFPKSLAADYLQNKTPPQMPGPARPAAEATFAKEPAPVPPTRPQVEPQPAAPPPKSVEGLDKFSPQPPQPLQAGKPAGKFTSGFTDASLDF